MNKNRAWLISFLTIAVVVWILTSSITAYIDPYMHFHKPFTDKFFYPLSLDFERSQNPGITRNFDYDALITGTSMTENFRTSEADTIFDAKFIKVPFSGGTFKEVNDNLEVALSTHPNIRYIIRSLDRNYFLDDKDRIRDDLGNYPFYLMDNNPFNDVEYVMNRYTLYTSDKDIIQKKKDGIEPGITSFDDYSNWMKFSTFGQKTVLKSFEEKDKTTESNERESLSDEDKEIIEANVIQNITSLANNYPETQFYYFLPPYSAVWFYNLKNINLLKKRFDVEEYATSLILPYDNIHLFAWDRFDITDDLNNYKDLMHYGDWINSWMLTKMKNEEGRLTKDNYHQYFKNQYDHYNSFDYSTLSKQEDYEADYYAAGLLNREISGTDPLIINKEFLEKTAIKNSVVIMDSQNEYVVIDCKGTMARNKDDELDVSIASYRGDYCGTEFELDATDYRAITFYGEKVAYQGQPSVYVYNESGNILRSIEVNQDEIDDQWHQYAVSLEGIYGNVEIIFNGGYVDNTGSTESEFLFSDIVIY